MMKWIALATVALIPGDPGDPEGVGKRYQFTQLKKIKTPSSDGDGGSVPILETPDPSNPLRQDIALHLSRLALIAARRTDDPCTGVGAILLMKNQIVSVGLNGYPSKASYGDFPRCKDPQMPVTSQKYPYLIHAEQNALLLRNTREIGDQPSTTMFVSKTPCNECAGLLVEAGVHNVVLPWREKLKEKGDQAEEEGEEELAEEAEEEVEAKEEEAQEQEKQEEVAEEQKEEAQEQEKKEVVAEEQKNEEAQEQEKQEEVAEEQKEEAEEEEEKEEVAEEERKGINYGDIYDLVNDTSFRVFYGEEITDEGTEQVKENLNDKFSKSDLMVSIFEMSENAN